VLSAGGIATYSKIVSASVKVAGAFTLTAFPNPVNNTLLIKSNSNARADILVLDMIGRIVKMSSTDNGNAELDMSHVEAGTYLVKYTMGQESHAIWINKR
jgi:hypothetical protein